MGLLAALTGVRARRTGEASLTEGQTDGNAGGLLQALWAFPGKVPIGTATVHVRWIALSLGISTLVTLLR